MGKIELIDTGRLTEKQARLNMEKCAEFLARMIQKYGDVVLGEIEERNSQLQGSDRVCRWSFGAAGLFALWKPHRRRWILGQFFWSFCELAQTGDSDIFYVRQPYDDGQPK